MEKELKDICIYGIMDDEELQIVLDKINSNEDISKEEIGDLLRQILHWRSQYHHESSILKITIQSRNRYRDQLKNK